jgi:hypothetical protein
VLQTSYNVAHARHRNIVAHLQATRHFNKPQIP